MKKLVFALACLLSAGLAHAQWTPLNSTTIETLNDVDFLDEDYGVIVGNGNTILLSTDGGLSWNDINYHNISGDVYNVKVTGMDTVFVSTYDWSTASAAVYYTTNAGVSWSTVASDPGINHRIDLETPAPYTDLFASSSHLISSANAGASWDTLVDNIAGMVSTDLLRFSNGQAGHLSGNVSGFAGYSAYFFRTEDGGKHWHRGESSMFPNSDAHTTMYLANPDTAYVFMNQYSGWAPSAVNRLVRMWNFNLAYPSPGDTVYTFNSALVSPLPDYMNDARFEDAMNGLALGNAGKIYRTVNGGSAWTVDYTDACGSCALLKMDFENGVGYAVGANGVLVKYAVATGLDATAEDNVSFSVYPNPGKGIFHIRLNGASAKVQLELFDALGKKMLSEEAEDNYRLDLTGFPKGVYIAKISSGTEILSRKIVLE